MSGLGGVVHWDGRSVEESTIRTMMERIRHRGPDGLAWDVQSNVGLGSARLALSSYDRNLQQPIWSRDHNLGLVAAARIYNRNSLVSELGTALESEDAASDAAILLAGYERWGPGLLDRLDGDFAFAIWDRGKQELLAARDPFGLRPFFYAWTPEGFRFGSEPKQVIDRAGSLPLNELSVGDFLLGRGGAYRETFVQGIERLEPGHLLVASGNGVSQEPYWRPWEKPVRGLQGRGEFVEGFRELLQKAVAKRLDIEGPVAAQLSGGFDSSAVVGVAGELYRSNATGLPDFLTISEVYPGLDCDESSYIRAMQHTVPFESRSIDCSHLGPMDDPSEYFAREDAPDLDMAAKRTELNVEALQDRNVRVLLTGLVGDELIWEPDWIPDLIRGGRWMEAGRQARRVSVADEEMGASRALFKGVLGAMPDAARSALRSFRGARMGGAPSWLTSDFQERLAHLRWVARPDPVGFPSRAQEQVYSWLTSPLTRWNLERAELRMSCSGIELRHPFLDRQLVEFVLGTPWRRRYRPANRSKPLLRDAVGDLLPREILNRVDGTTFDFFFARLLAAWAPGALQELGSTDIWLSEVYTRRRAVVGSLKKLDSGVIGPGRKALQLWAACHLELWMRNRLTAC